MALVRRRAPPAAAVWPLHPLAPAAAATSEPCSTRHCWCAATAQTGARAAPWTAQAAAAVWKTRRRRRPQARNRRRSSRWHTRASCATRWRTERAAMPQPQRRPSAPCHASWHRLMCWRARCASAGCDARAPGLARRRMMPAARQPQQQPPRPRWRRWRARHRRLARHLRTLLGEHGAAVGREGCGSRQAAHPASLARRHRASADHGWAHAG